MWSMWPNHNSFVPILLTAFHSVCVVTFMLVTVECNVQMAVPVFTMLLGTLTSFNVESGGTQVRYFFNGYYRGRPKAEGF